MESRKLELADIAMYLPYGLKVKLSQKGIFNLDEEYPDSTIHNATYKITDMILGENPEIQIQDIKRDFSIGYIEIDEVLPVLRPMSDLIKPMTHPDVNDGEEFMPLTFLTKEITNHDVSLINEWNLYDDHIWVHYEYDGGKKESCLINFFIYALPLFNQLHFDYNSLIEQGLAIDINTL